MAQSISKILIANRGEIACRIIKTARRMGIQTVAVYSDADSDAVHVRLADQSIHIGASPSAESYLVIEKIIAACKESGADSVHPGYGFLSENPNFVRACDAAGVTFIGPKAHSMEAMGLKDAAKKLMEKAGVPVTPGYHGANQDPSTLKAEADKIGYPVLIKAVAGGGGKGMRKVETAATFLADLASCQREAKASFSDDRVLIEKYIASPRHIEVQVFGDTHGDVIHLFERDCSLQRRHQKVVEEAPAPGMTDEVRRAMTDAAVQAAKVVDYVGAGTVEFIVDGSSTLSPDGFWFMEMNTRLQVEHPVTEMITGLDLVEWQIRVARGESLPSQDKIKIEGHSLEARLYAEDPENDFLPNVGPLEILEFPDGVRIDTGVEQGGEVSIFYDPMISKMITHAPTRHSAIEALKNCARKTHVYPVKTNARFVSNCLNHPEFIAGNISTHFITTYENSLISADTLDADKEFITDALLEKRANAPYDKKSGWRLNLPPRSAFYRIYEGREIELPVSPNAARKDYYTKRYNSPDGEVVFVNGKFYLIKKNKPAQEEGLNSDIVVAAMPGVITALNVSVGDAVKKGDALIVMEAMKMEMTLNAPRDGVIETINPALAALVAGNDILLTLKKEPTQ